MLETHGWWEETCGHNSVETLAITVKYLHFNRWDEDGPSAERARTKPRLASRGGEHTSVRSRCNSIIIVILEGDGFNDYEHE